MGREREGKGTRQRRGVREAEKAKGERENEIGCRRGKKSKSKLEETMQRMW